MSLDPINPEDLGPTPGYSNGQLGREGGRVLFVAGQIGVTVEPHGAEPPMVVQFGEALPRLLTGLVPVEDEDQPGHSGDPE